MNFGKALDHAKQGEKIARKGWNGKDMWVAMTPGKVLNLNEHNIWGVPLDVAKLNGGAVEILPYMVMKTVDNKLVIGWLASQPDMLSDDWFVVNE